MELEIGKYCEMVDCNQLDFCPFMCYCCKKYFCLEHYKYKSHNCVNAPESKIIQVDIKDEKKVQVKCDVCNRKIIDALITPYICNKCNMTVCMKHRVPEYHDCKWLKIIAQMNRRRIGKN